MSIDTAVRLDRLDQMATRLDSQFRVPGTDWRFGWDSILGLVPGLGDLVTIGPAAWAIKEGHSLGARRRALVRMGLNSGIDLFIGGIPVLGDAFDAAFKANRRNLAILRADLAAQGRLAPQEKIMAERKRSSDGSRDTDKVMGEAGTVSQSARNGGRLAREVGTQDELKRATERPAGATRVTKSQEEENSDGS